MTRHTSRRNFIKNVGTTVAIAPFVPLAIANGEDDPQPTGGGKAATCDYRLLRHAAAILNYNEKKILIDPMLNNRFTTVALPVDRTELTGILEDIDAVLLTHNHGDHISLDGWHVDLMKDKPFFCQSSADGNFLSSLGIQDVRVIGESIEYDDITIYKTGGRHGVGTGWHVSGFVFTADGNKSVYIVGDTTYAPEVADALDKYEPEVTIVNSGAVGPVSNPWTMTAEHVGQVAQKLPSTQIIAVHLEVHPSAQVTRAQLRKYTEDNGIENRVLIPADGDSINLCDTTSIEHINTNDKRIKVWPNPFKDEVYMDIPGKLQHIRILDLNGRLINTLYSPEWNGLDGSGQPVPTGTYVLFLSVDDRVYVKRVLKH